MTTRVRITSRVDGGGTIEVDGHDLSKAVLKDGLRVTWPLEGPAQVHMVIAADVLDVDLPKAVLAAMRMQPSAVEES